MKDIDTKSVLRVFSNIHFIQQFSHKILFYEFNFVLNCELEKWVHNLLVDVYINNFDTRGVNQLSTIFPNPHREHCKIVV